MNVRVRNVQFGHNNQFKMATGDLTDVKGQHREAMESHDPSKNLGQNFEKKLR